jgi:CheY-like chemotaxis protein
MVADRILIVDDAASFRILLADLFQGAGYTVQTAGNGQQALRAVEIVSFSVVLTDVDMPIMDGREFARRLKQRGLAIPLVVMTALPGVAAVATAIGAAAYLQKPFPLATALTTIEKVIHSARSAPIGHVR